MSGWDAIILGSSPDALTCAAYLARSGKKILVLEPTEHIGGAMTTADFADGLMGDIGLTSGRLEPQIVRDLKLEQHGLEIIERDSLTSLLPNGRSFTLPADRDAAVEVIRNFAAEDAARYKPFMQLLDLGTNFLRTAYTITPPAQHPPSVADLNQLARLVAELRGYGRREMTEVMRILVMSLRHLLDEWFGNPELKGLLGSAGVRALHQGPFAGATTFNLLHHLAIGDAYFRCTARGGVGAISQALLNAAIVAGAEVRTKIGLLHVNIADAVATGVHVDGQTIEAGMIVSAYDARQTFTQLVPPPELEPEFNRAVKHIRYNGTVARINLALSALPEFQGVAAEALRGTLTLSPSLAYLEKAFDGAKQGGLAKHPFLEVTLPSVSDSSLAPAGKHVMSIWFQYAPYRNALDSAQVYELAIDTLSHFAPRLKKLVEHSQTIMPGDFETRFLLSEGHLYGGEMTLEQAFFLRPLPGFAQYRTPIKNLFLCGAGTHPGGGLHGLCGLNAARELAVDDLVAV